MRKKLLSLLVLSICLVGCSNNDKNSKNEEKQVIVEDPDVTEPVTEYKMPIIRINTENGAPIVSKEVYINSSVSVENCDNKEFEFDDVVAEIRGRGNTSWGAPKKSYRVKFGKKRSMFGSEYKAKSWTLIANYFDYSLVRNYLFYKMASLLDDVKFSSAHQFVELYLNGEYQGVYLFCDQMQTGDGRVDIDESISESGDNGYFLEMNYRVPQEGGRENIEYFVSNHGTIYEIKTPDTEDENYLKNPQKYVDFIKNSVNAAYSSTAANKSWEQITNLIDVNTFADGYIVEELAKNTDVMGLSTFLVKDKGGKIEFGPVWDFDISSGNVNYGPGTQESCPATDLWADKVWFSRLLGHNEFKILVAEKLEKYQPIIDELIDELDVEKEGSLYKKYGEKFEKNFEKWNILGTNVWNQTDEILKLKTNKEQIIFLKNWLTFRNNYLQTIYEK